MWNFQDFTAKHRLTPKTHFVLLKCWAEAPSLVRLPSLFWSSQQKDIPAKYAKKESLVSTGHKTWKGTGQCYLLKLSIRSVFFFTPFNNIKMSWFIDKLEFFKRKNYSFIKWLFNPSSTVLNSNIKIFIRHVKLERLWKFLSLRSGILKNESVPYFVMFMSLLICNSTLKSGILKNLKASPRFITLSLFYPASIILSAYIYVYAYILYPFS